VQIAEQERRIESCCVTCCSLLRIKERYCCIIVIRCCDVQFTVEYSGATPSVFPLDLVFLHFIYCSTSFS